MWIIFVGYMNFMGLYSSNSQSIFSDISFLAYDTAPYSSRFAVCC